MLFKELLTGIRLDRSKLEKRSPFLLQDEDHRSIAQIAHAVEQDDSPVLKFYAGHLI